MRKYFEVQLKQAEKLTEDSINGMKQRRMDKMTKLDLDNIGEVKPESSFKTPIVVGDVLLFFMEAKTSEDTGCKIGSILLRELDKLDSYKYDRMEQSIPIFIR